jgi:hypothetical protein
MNWISIFYFYIRLKKAVLICCITIIVSFIGLKTYSQSTSSQLIHQTVLQIKEDTNTVKRLIDSSQSIILLDSARAMQLAERSLTVAEKLNDKKQIIRGHIQVGNVYAIYQQHEKALVFYNEAADLAQNKFADLLPVIYVNLAAIYNKQGFFQKSVEYYQKSLVICKQYNNKRKEAGILKSMGVLFLNNKQYRENILYQKKALDIYKEIDNKPGLVSVFCGLSLGYISLYKEEKVENQYLDSAFFYCEEGFAIINTKVDLGGNIHLEPYLYQAKSETFFLKQDFTKALDQAELAIAKSLSINDKDALSTTYLLMSKIHAATKNYKEAEKKGDTAMRLAELIKDPVLLNDCYKQLTILQTVKGDAGKAFHFQSKLMMVKDSLFTVEKAKSINALSIQYETAKKELQIQKLEKEKILISISAFAGLCISLLFLRGYRLKRKILIQQQQLLTEENQKIVLEKQIQEEVIQKAQLEKQVASEEKKKVELERQLEAEEKFRLQREYENALAINQLKQEQLQQEIDYKYRELTSQVVLLEKKNDFLLQIKEDIQQTQKTATNGSGEGVLKNINKLIDQHLSHEGDFENFRIHFEKVHPCFFDKLLEKSQQQVSQLDLRHCAYIKLNLGTKEIANLLNVEPKSIRMARYRLKQKFQLEKKMDLQAYINSV